MRFKWQAPPHYLFGDAGQIIFPFVSQLFQLPSWVSCCCLSGSALLPNLLFILTAYRREQKGKKEASEQKKKDKDKKTDSEEQDKSRDEDNDEDEERLEEEEQNEEEEVDNWGEWGDAPWKESRENLVHVCVKLFPAGQSSLRQKSLRRLK